jgi:hypothetical protein
VVLKIKPTSGAIVGIISLSGLLSVINIAYAVVSDIVSLGTVILASIVMGAIVATGAVIYTMKVLKREWHVLQCAEDEMYRMIYLPIPGTEPEIRIGYWRKFDCQENPVKAWHVT